MMQRGKGARWPELPSYALDFIGQREKKQVTSLYGLSINYEPSHE